jgi:Spy/CpxP family protein refolding chaperone
MHRTRPTSTVTALRLSLGAAVLALAAVAQAAPHGPGALGGMDSMGGMRAAMMGDGRHLGPMLDQVNATAEQRSQIQAIVNAARADLRAQRSAGPALHLEMAQLLAQPTVDARAVEALRQKMLAQHDQASQRWTQAMLEISRVLTPEQRQQAAERLRQRLAMVQRHRAERESLEVAPR